MMPGSCCLDPIENSLFSLVALDPYEGILYKTENDFSNQLHSLGEVDVINL